MKQSIKKHKRMNTLAICLSVVMLVLLLLLNLAVSTFFHYYDIISEKNGEDFGSLVLSQSDQYLSDVADVEIRTPQQDVYSSKGYVNILLIGTDERTENLSSSRADSMILLSLNTKTYDMKLVSFERDMYVAIPKVPKRNPDKLGHTFRYGGAPLLMETLQTHFSLDVKQYIRVNFTIFMKLIDEIGGVDIQLNQSEANILTKHSYAVHNAKSFREGINHLDGDSALTYSRIRVIDSDWQRVQRQRNVLVAVKNSLAERSIGELKTLSDKCLPYIQTNLSPLDCADLMMHIARYAKGDLKQMTIPKKGTFYSLKKVDFAANAAILRKFLYDE